MPGEGALDAVTGWASALDAKRSYRRLLRRSLPLVMGFWAAILLLLTLTDYGLLRHKNKKKLSVPLTNSDMVEKGFILKGPHILCPYQAKYKLGTPVNETKHCRCDAGWTGPTCGVAICTSPCGHGHCFKPNQCKCNKGWKGKFCNEAVCTQGCKHGTCTAPNICTCEEEWQGMTCSVLCVHGTFQGEGALKSGKPLNACQCDPGWRGTACTKAICARYGCVHGSCMAPDSCVCDTGWRGSDCADDALLPVSKKVLQGVYVERSAFQSLTVHRGSPEEVWTHLQGYTDWSVPDRAADRKVLQQAVSLNDTLSSSASRGGSGAGFSLSRGQKRWQRCAIVGDGAGLLRTELGAMIDRHDSVLRFNLAPTTGMQEHVGQKTTVRLLNRKAIEILLRRSSQGKGSKSRGGAGSAQATVADGGIHVLWRPDTYYLLPTLRRHLPRAEFALLRSEWVDTQVKNYKTILHRLVSEGILDDEEKGAERHADQFVDPTTFLDGLHRIPTSFMGIALMIQLCGHVHVFGFDPPHVQRNTKDMGYRTGTYYSSQVGALAATEAEDEALVLADQDPAGSLRPNRGTDVTVFTPQGEVFPGAGGRYARGALDQMVLHLMELDGYVTVCTTEQPERCLSVNDRGR